MLGLFKKPVGGCIGYYGLQSWWASTFTSAEQEYVVEKYAPLGLSAQSRSLVSGNLSSSSHSVITFLHTLAGWFSTKADRHLAKRILAHAAVLSKTTPCSIVDRHFLYHQVIATYYPDRDSDPNALEKAITACQDQIAIAEDAAKAFRKAWSGDPLPAHQGYKQLAIILEKRGDLEQAIAISRQAERQGWAGDWPRRIDRLTKKLQKR